MHGIHTIPAAAARFIPSVIDPVRNCTSAPVSWVSLVLPIPYTAIAYRHNSELLAGNAVINLLKNGENITHDPEKWLDKVADKFDRIG